MPSIRGIDEAGDAAHQFRPEGDPMNKWILAAILATLAVLMYLGIIFKAS